MKTKLITTALGFVVGTVITLPAAEIRAGRLGASGREFTSELKNSSKPTQL